MAQGLKSADKYQLGHYANAVRQPDVIVHYNLNFVKRASVNKTLLACYETPMSER